MRYLNALNKISGVGPQRIKTLLGFFHNSENIWRANLEELKKSGIGEKISEKIYLERKNINPEFEWEKIHKEKIEMITQEDLEYPEMLREIHNPPYILYVKGKKDFNKFPMIAIVGSRKYTNYGSTIATSLAKDLSDSGFSVVSGMALGIDTFAHRGALQNSGKTIAVLGNSLEDKNIYPRNNLNLSKEILENGSLVSEYSLETEAGPLTFPARNRIIAGLCCGTIVIEAGERSGALITAGMALEYNREIFSVPGSIFSHLSIGTNNLIRNGAKIVTGVKDILEEFDFNKEKIKKESTPRKPENKEEEKILKILSSDPIHIDNISKIAKLQATVCISTLSIMEIKGWVKNIGGQNYIIL